MSVIEHAVRIVKLSACAGALTFGMGKVGKLSEQKRAPLRVGTLFTAASTSLDPANITTLEEYELLRNLYGRLLEYDAAGNLVPGVPTSFEWVGSDLVFEFGDKVRTVDGQLVGAEDAERSLKRTIVLKNTGHGDIRNFFCPGFELESTEAACPGIRVEGNRLILTPAKDSLRSQFLAALESADFSIIPLASLSTDPRNSKIVGLRNTSGPYYVAADDAGGAWVLEANRTNYLFDPQMPLTINLVPLATQDALAELSAGHVDLLPTYYYFKGHEAKSVLADTGRFSVHESAPIRVGLVCFTPTAVREFTTAQRLYAARRISQYLTINYPQPEAKPTVEFFQALSDGSLTGEQRRVLEARAQNVEKVKFDRPIELAASEAAYEKMKTFFRNDPQIKVVRTSKSAYLLPLAQRPHAYLLANDAAWTESVSLLSYNFNVGVFHLPGIDGQSWIRDYVATEDRLLRLAKLRAFHLELLESAVIVPFEASPYFAVAAGSWTLPFSTTSAGTQLWRVRPKR